MKRSLQRLKLHVGFQHLYTFVQVKFWHASLMEHAHDKHPCIDPIKYWTESLCTWNTSRINYKKVINILGIYVCICYAWIELEVKHTDRIGMDSETSSGGISVNCKRSELIFWSRPLCSGAKDLHRFDSSISFCNLEWSVHKLSRKKVNASEENGLSRMNKLIIVSWSRSTVPRCCSPPSSMLQ